MSGVSPCNLKGSPRVDRVLRPKSGDGGGLGLEIETRRLSELRTGGVTVGGGGSSARGPASQFHLLLLQLELQMKETLHVVCTRLVIR
jgi:hypothetical protein